MLPQRKKKITFKIPTQKKKRSSQTGRSWAQLKRLSPDPSYERKHKTRPDWMAGPCASLIYRSYFHEGEDFVLKGFDW